MKVNDVEFDSINNSIGNSFKSNGCDNNYSLINCDNNDDDSFMNCNELCIDNRHIIF